MKELFWHQNNVIVLFFCFVSVGIYVCVCVLSQVVLIFLMEVFSYFLPSLLFIFFIFVSTFFPSILKKAICCRWRSISSTYFYYIIFLFQKFYWNFRTFVLCVSVFFFQGKCVFLSYSKMLRAMKWTNPKKYVCMCVLRVCLTFF